MSKLTNVEFYGTGGGCVMYSAKVNDDAWIATDFDSVEYYDKNVEEVDEDFLNGIPYEDHIKIPAGPLPTWGEVFQSICECVPSEKSHATIIMEDYDMNAVCDQGLIHFGDNNDDNE